MWINLLIYKLMNIIHKQTCDGLRITIRYFDHVRESEVCCYDFSFIWELMFNNVAVSAISRASCYIVVLTPSQKGIHPKQYHLCKHVVMCVTWHSESECSNLYTNVM